jgi:hypothetical protein
MKRQIVCAVTLLGVLCGAGCGSDSTAVNTAATGTVVSAPAAAVGAREVAGVWQGTLPGTTESVWLSLAQEGHKIAGDGAVFSNNLPKAVHISGTVNDEGEAALNLVPHDHDDSNDDLVLWITFTANTPVQASLSNATVPEGVELTLSRPPAGPVASEENVHLKLWDDVLVPSQTGLKEAYQVEATGGGGKSYRLQFQLASTDRYGFAGSWEMQAGSDSFHGGVRQGRVAAANALSGTWSRVSVKDTYGLLSYGEVWFKRLAEGQAGGRSALDGTSRLDSRVIQGAVVLVTP